MIKAFILDDDPPAIDTLTWMPDGNIPEAPDFRTGTDPAKSTSAIRKFNPQLLFLGIKTPKLFESGLLEKLEDLNPTIIFLTSDDPHTLGATRFSSLDYLVKPIDPEALRIIIQQYFTAGFPGLPQPSLVEILSANLSCSSPESFRLAIPTREALFLFDPSEIIRLEGESNFTWVYLPDRKPLLTTRPLNTLEDALGDRGFLRIHKSHLINRRYIVNFTQKGTLTLSDRSQFDISRRRKEDILEVLNAG